jgi:hypothetical protein
MSEAPAQPKNPERLEVEELTRLQPGLARLMPEIANRYWKCAHAGRARNWDLARWQLKEMVKLFRLGNVTRPKYEKDVETFIHEDIEPIRIAIENSDLEAFNHAIDEAIDAANDFHRRWNKQFIVWKLPEQPPQDLVLTPRSEP